MSKAYTKEEYMKKWPMDEIPDNIRELAVAWGAPFHLFIEDTVKLARDILEATEVHRKETSIAFAGWLSINGWYLNKIKRWSNRNNNSDNLLDVLSATKTTEELYTLHKGNVALEHALRALQSRLYYEHGLKQNSGYTVNKKEHTIKLTPTRP